jgi:hypothetical protein
VRRAKRAAYFNKVERKRQEWLAAMNADAKNWIAADEIDAVRSPLPPSRCYACVFSMLTEMWLILLQKITAETFAATHPWQFDKYYAHQAARQAEMYAIRACCVARRVHFFTIRFVHMILSLRDGSTQFPEDWESDIDADAVDLWEPLDRKLATGVQLEVRCCCNWLHAIP